MRYAVLCYNDEAAVGALTRRQDEAMMAGIAGVKRRLAAQGRFGPSARLMPTTAAVTVRETEDEPLVVDGPFAETKEQLLGFYVLDCATLEQAIEATTLLAKERQRARLGGALELRPILSFDPGGAMP